jgi:putative ABC transport system permease protein
MTSFFEDLRLAARTFRRRPGLPAVIVATLGLAIGANAAVFSFVDSLLLRPLPVEAQERLVRIYSRFASGLEWASVSYPNYRDYERGNRVFSALAAEANQALVVGDSASSQLVLGALVSANWFSTLGVRPAPGRGFRPEEERAPSAVAVIADGFWRRYLGADPRALGKTLRLNGAAFKIVGVAPPGFRGPNTGLETEVWVPISMQAAIIPGSNWLVLRDSNWLQLTGRLRPGVTLAQARAAMNALAARLRQIYPRDNEGMSLTLLPESRARIYPPMRGGIVVLSALLQTVVGLVLAVACANAAGLLLARGSARSREIAIRLALGARTGRLVRMLVTESLLLGLAGGAAGLVLAFWATRLFGSFSLQMQMPVSFRVEVDSRVLVLTLGVALATGVLFGLAPALQIARPRLAAAIREGGADAGPRRSRLRGALVVAQIAATFVLLVGASLFFRSLRNVEAADLGFRTQGLLVASFNLGYSGYGKRDGRRFLERLEARLRELPGVRAVSLATRLPLSLMHRTVDAAPEGYVPPRAGEGKPELDVNSVAPDYFKTLEIPLVAGREFTPADRQGAQLVAVVNEALARRFFPAGQALGRRLVVGDTPFTVVGVVRDGKQLSLQGEQRPYVYLDLFQEYEPAVTIHLGTDGDAAALAPALRREVRQLDPRVALFDVKPMARQLDFSLLPQRLAGGLLAAMGALALALALLGLYAATAYALARRTREIGIHIALGAGHRQLLALLLRGGAGQCALGLAIGVAMTLLCGRLAASLLFGVNPADPASLAATAALVAGLSLAANLFPAMAALHVDPRQALAAE